MVAQNKNYCTPCPVGGWCRMGRSFGGGLWGPDERFLLARLLGWFVPRLRFAGRARSHHPCAVHCCSATHPPLPPLKRRRAPGPPCDLSTSLPQKDQYRSNFGATTCMLCPRGTDTQDNANTDCTNCPIGYYNGVAGGFPSTDRPPVIRAYMLPCALLPRALLPCALQPGSSRDLHPVRASKAATPPPLLGQRPSKMRRAPMPSTPRRDALRPRPGRHIRQHDRRLLRHTLVSELAAATHHACLPARLPCLLALLWPPA